MYLYIHIDIYELPYILKGSTATAMLRMDMGLPCADHVLASVVRSRT